MGALTIKNYAFQYRPWELESQIITNLFSLFPENIVLYFKNKKLIRVLPEFSNEFLPNTVRFFFKKINPFSSLNHKKVNSSLRFFLVHVFYSILIFLFNFLFVISSKKAAAVLTFFDFSISKRTETHLIQSRSLFFSVESLIQSFLQFNAYIEGYLSKTNFIYNKPLLFSNNLNNFVVFSKDSLLIKELTLNNVCNLTLIELKKKRNINLHLFLSIFFLHTKYYVLKKSDLMLDNARLLTFFWTGFLPCRFYKKYNSKFNLYFNSTLKKKTILTWSGNFKQSVSIII